MFYKPGQRKLPRSYKDGARYHRCIFLVGHLAALGLRRECPYSLPAIGMSLYSRGVQGCPLVIYPASVACLLWQIDRLCLLLAWPPGYTDDRSALGIPPCVDEYCLTIRSQMHAPSR